MNIIYIDPGITSTIVHVIDTDSDCIQQEIFYHNDTNLNWQLLSKYLIKKYPETIYKFAINSNGIGIGFIDWLLKEGLRDYIDTGIRPGNKNKITHYYCVPKRL